MAEVSENELSSIKPKLAPGLERLLRVVIAKMRAHAMALDPCPAYGRITWRIKPGGEIEVDLEPKL